MVLSLRRHRAVTGWDRVVRSGVEARSPTFAKAPADAKERALRRSSESTVTGYRQKCAARVTIFR
jgi:hypothetical protein